MLSLISQMENMFSTVVTHSVACFILLSRKHSLLSKGRTLFQLIALYNM